jgi:hypothetical protein
MLLRIASMRGLLRSQRDVSKRFATQKPAGLRIGGYGWVLNLKPTAKQAPAPTPDGETGEVFAMTGDPGFIHAPS